MTDARRGNGRRAFVRLGGGPAASRTFLELP
jgi:hypothetical protein